MEAENQNVQINLHVLAESPNPAACQIHINLNSRTLVVGLHMRVEKHIMQE